MIRNKAINALIEMGMPANNKGFHYIVDAILLLDSGEWNDCKMTALYEKIAKKNNATIQSVERAIRHAFEIVLVSGNLKAVNKYLTFQKTTNGNLLHVFYIRLTQEE